VVVQEPVLQDLVGRRVVWVGDDVLNEAELVLAKLNSIPLSLRLSGNQFCLV
jgi:hypothetical protein